jgi:hypothetical protein
MTETLTATDTESPRADAEPNYADAEGAGAATAVAEETASAAAMGSVEGAEALGATGDGGAGAAGADAAKPMAVPVSRAIGGPRRKRSDQRWEVTEADLNMYTLIVGRAPSEAERVAALTPVPNEATALRDAGAGRGGSGAFLRWRDRAHQADLPTWSPAVMFSYLRDVYHFSTNLTGPHVAAWVRHVSTEARRRLQETQARLAPPRTR